MAEGLKLEDYLAFIERSRGGATRRIPWEQLRDAADRFTDEFPCIVQAITKSSKLGRARKLTLSETVEITANLGPPTPEQCKGPGRCHREGDPMAYLGVGTELALSEIGARVGDRVGMIHLQPSREMRLLRVGAIDLYRRTSGICDLDDGLKTFIAQLPKDREGIRVHLLDAFIADFFSRPGNADIYKVSSTFARVLLDAFPALDGIMYDSVSHIKGACIALRPASYATMIVTEAQIININADLGYGIYDFEEECFCDETDGDRLIWRKR